MLFPLPLYYILFLGLARLVWRRGRLDRGEKLFWLLISIAGIWASVLVGLILNKDLASAYGRLIFLESTFIAIVAGAVVFLAYLHWPPAGGAPISDMERRDFRSGIAAETFSILKKFTDPLNHGDMSLPIWSGKTPESKAAILGKEDYLVLHSFYDALEERNRYFASRHGFDFATLDPLNQRCVEALSRAYSEVTWLKTASDTDSLLSKARKSVGLPSQITKQTPDSPPLVMKMSDRSYDPDIAARLDPAFAGVHALFFWPKECSWQKGEREPTINMPYTKVIIKGTEAFWWGAYAEELFRKGKIEYNNAPGDFESEDDMEVYLRENGINLHKWPVSPKDLLEPASQ